MPAPTVRLAPNRAVIRGVIGATMSMIGDMGRVRRAAWRGSRPSTSWKYWVMRNSTPYMPRKTRIIPPVPTLNDGLRKKRMSSIGSFTRNSHRAKMDRTTADRANAPSVTVLVQPLSGASIRA